MSGFDLFEEIKRDTMLHAYVVTGNEKYLKEAEKVKPQDIPCRVSLDLERHLRQEERPEPEFDIHDDDLMRDIIGARLDKPVQALLESYEGMCLTPNAVSLEALKEQLRALYQAVKAEAL